MKRVLIFNIIFSFCFAGCVSVYQSLDITLINEDMIPINKEEYTNKMQEIFRYECNRLDYNNKLKIRAEFGKSQKNYRGVIKCDSLGFNFITNPDSAENISDAESILSRQIGYALYFSWINKEYGTDNYYWDAGIATWLAGKYYLGNKNYRNFSEALESIISKGRFLDLEYYSSVDNVNPNEWHTLNLESASFIDFLVSYYGLDKVYELSREFIAINNKNHSESFIIWRDRFRMWQILQEKSNNAYGKPDSWLGDNISKWKLGNHKEKIIPYSKNEAYKSIFGSSYEELVVKWLSVYDTLPARQN